MFCAYLIERGHKSATVKLYVSGIKKFLVEDGYKWNDSLLLLNSMTRACKLKNDVVSCRRPTSRRLLEIIIFKLHRWIDSPYLQILYKAALCLGYYGMMRVGELTNGPHAAKACNVHVGRNKDKILVILYSSKMHSKESHPQEIKITSLSQDNAQKNVIICPFNAIRNYTCMKGGYATKQENFFIFADRSPVLLSHLHKVLCTCIAKIHLNPLLFYCHSLRIGHTSDLMKMGVPIEKIKIMGRWKSNAVYKYVRNF